MKVKVILMAVIASVIIIPFNSCSRKTAEEKARRQLSAARFVQGIISSSTGVNIINNLLDMQVRNYKYKDGTTHERITVNGVSCDWIIPSQIMPDNVLLYFHGGGFAIGMTGGHMKLIATLASKMKLKVLSVNYRLAPKHPFPAALDDCVTAYNWLLSQGYPPSGIVFAGDSAGGNLAVTSLLRLRELDMPFPAAAAALSPVVTFAPSANTRDGYKDPLLNAKMAEFFNRSYVGNADPANPLISPLFADLRGLPPILVHIGEDEVLLDNAVKLFGSAREAGADITLKIFPGMWHVWQLYPDVPQTDQSLGEIANFLMKYLY